MPPPLSLSTRPHVHCTDPESLFRDRELKFIILCLQFEHITPRDGRRTKVDDDEFSWITSERIKGWQNCLPIVWMKGLKIVSVDELLTFDIMISTFERCVQQLYTMINFVSDLGLCKNNASRRQKFNGIRVNLERIASLNRCNG